jgi:hypothetical protein
MTDAASAGGGGGTILACPANGATSVSALAPFSYDWIGGDIRGLSNLAQTLYEYVPGIGGVTSTLDDQVQGLVGAAHWTGAAASAFDTAYEADAEAAHGLAALIEDAGEIIDGLAVALSRIESSLEQAAAKAKAHGAPIEANGAPLEACLAGTTTAEKEAALWLQWYQEYYQDAMNAANKVRNEAASDLNGLPFSGVKGKGGSGWETALVAVGRHIDDVLGGAQGALSGVGKATTEASALMRAGDSGGAQTMALLRNNATWRELGQLGRSDATELAGKFLLGAGAVLTGIGVYQQTHSIPQAVIDAGADTGISYGLTVGGTAAGRAAAAALSAGAGAEDGGAAGAEAGSFIGPEGTLVGAGVGALVGAGVGFVVSGEFNHLIGDLFG